MIKKIALGVAGALVAGIAVILILSAMKPDHFRIQRTATIKAPPEKIMPLLADLRRHREWSPWEQKDPAMKRSYSGAPSGKGAVYEWDGNSNIGAGRMEVTEASATKIVYDMLFLKPWEAHNTAEIVMVPGGASTDITWAMSGPNPYFGRIIHTLIDVDKMVGVEFTTGLANLKSIAEK
jgi:hypothetical protein